MWYTNEINAALIEKVCTPVLVKLIAEEYRSGFNDSVLMHLRNAVESVDARQAEALWSAGCCGDMEIGRRDGWAKMGFSAKFMKLYSRACEESRKEGCFVMPEWGIRGT